MHFFTQNHGEKAEKNVELYNFPDFLDLESTFFIDLVFVRRKNKTCKMHFFTQNHGKKENVKLYCEFRDGSKLETSFVKPSKS